MPIAWPTVLICLGSGMLLTRCEAWWLALTMLTATALIACLRPSWRLPLVIGLLIVLAGVGLYEYRLLPSNPNLPGSDRVGLTGRIDSIPYQADSKTVFVLSAEDDSPYKRRVRVVCLFEAAWHRGDMVCLEGKLKVPRRPGNPGQFDFPSYLANQGIYYNLTVSERHQAQQLKAARGPLSWMDGARSRAEGLTRQELTPDEAAILLGMIWGGRAGMDDHLYEDFQKTGIVHLFSVGGLHVGFLLVLVNWLASLLNLGVRGKFGAGVTALLVYGTMVAWPPPVVRAVLMGILGWLAYLSGRENGMLNALSISGIFILLLRPAQLFDLSFQLTMLATGGLVCLFPRLRAALPGRGLVKDLVLIPACAEITILPLIAYHFNIVTPGSLVTNIATTYLAGAAVILGFIASLLAPFSTSLASLFLHPAGMFIELIIGVVDWVEGLPGAYLYVAQPSVPAIWGYYLALVLAWFSVPPQRHRCLTKVSVGLLLVWLMVLLIPAGACQKGRMEMVFLDVGQGDSILVKSPGGRFMLVDGGGSQWFEVGSDIVLPYLHHRGIRRLDMVISTHPDIDHYQGLLEVVQAMPVGCLGIPASLADDQQYQALQEMAVQKNIPMWALYDGQSIHLEEGFEIDILHPDRRINSADANHESVVIMLSYRGFSALLTGDAGCLELVSACAAVQGPVTVVKIPHHGSKGSLAKELYQQIDARLAVISVGADNHFGHPSAVVLSALEEAGIRVLRTDQDGAVVISSDGRRCWVATTIGECPR